MFGTVLTLLGTLLHLYCYYRARSVPVLRSHPRAIIAVLLVAWATFVLGRAWAHGATGTAAAILELVGLTWLVSLFLICVCLFVVDLITGFGLLFPRYAPALRGWALIAGAALSAIALVQGLRPPVVQSYELTMADLPRELDGTVLVAMSDLHLGSQLGESWMNQRLAQIEALRPDLVVLLGDLVEGHGSSETNLLAGLDRISVPLGVWAVPGNHESYGARSNASSLLGRPGMQVLMNQSVQLRPGLILAGVQDLTVAGPAARQKELVEQALANRPQGATILLSHTPWQTDTAAARGVNLMLSGHTHAGQVWPFTYLVRIRYPLVAGRYEVGNMTTLVCRGTGTWGPRMRLWQPGEILRITLRAPT